MRFPSLALQACETMRVASLDKRVEEMIGFWSGASVEKTIE
jgi:hypothetical protein